METPKTPENAPKIPRDESFKTCKASPVVRRQLRSTPARLSILSGNKPFKEAGSSHKKFNSRRKACQHNDTAGSNETFIRHEQDLLYDRDSLDPSQQLPQHFIDNVTQQVIAPRTSSPKIKRHTDKEQPNPKRKSSPKKSSPKKASPRKLSSPSKIQPTRIVTRPLPKPRPLAAPKPRAQQPIALQWNRYMSSTAKKPMGPPTSQFKKPVMNSSVASSRRCLGQWNTPRITRTQSFRSTAELERDYISSLRSSRS